MPIPLGILAAAGVRPAGAAGAYELIETISVGAGGAASVTFSNLNTYSSTYQHLQIRYLARTTRAATDDDLRISFNGVTTDYRRHQLYGGELSTAQSFSNADRVVGFCTAANSASGNFAAGVIDILDPYESKNKTVRSLTGGTNLNRIFLMSNGWFNTSAVSSIELSGNSGNLAQYSRFSIYGLKAS